MDSNLNLWISFPSCDEDHRLQLVDVNGTMFAVLFGPLSSEGPINLQCEDWNLILVAPIRSAADVHIQGVNVACLGQVESTGGQVSIEAAQRLIYHGASVESRLPRRCEGGLGEWFAEPGDGLFADLQQLLMKMVPLAREGTKEAQEEARQRFLSALCALAQWTAADRSKELSMLRVMETWGIPVQ